MHEAICRTVSRCEYIALILHLTFFQELAHVDKHTEGENQIVSFPVKAVTSEWHSHCTLK